MKEEYGRPMEYKHRYHNLTSSTVHVSKEQKRIVAVRTRPIRGLCVKTCECGSSSSSSLCPVPSGGQSQIKNTVSGADLSKRVWINVGPKHDALLKACLRWLEEHKILKVPCLAHVECRKLAGDNERARFKAKSDLADVIRNYNIG